MKESAIYRFLSKKGLNELVSKLLEQRVVYGTILKDGFPAFGEISSPAELVLAHTPTHISAKEFLFPQRETLLKYDVEKGNFEAVVESRDQAIVGLHSCDIHAISLMDRVFAYGTPDVNYLARRQRTVLIGTDCVPDRFCFCSSVNTMNVEEGFDLFLHTLKKGYLVRTGSKWGADFLNKLETREPTKAELKEKDLIDHEREGAFKTHLKADAALLPSIYAKSNDSPVWEKIGKICYGCGSCNNVCPTCYCFDVQDTVSADFKQAQRVRNWDACTLADFAKVAGGHNFRTRRAERLRHRFNRKFNYLSDRFDALFCVGCGRCSRTCLVNINIAEVTNELIREAAGKGK